MNLLLPIALATLTLAGCATAPGIDTTRFHLGQPIARGSVAVTPLDAARASSLEYRSQAEVVGAALSRAGFTPAPALAQAEFVASFALAREYRAPAQRGSGLTIGIGGGVGGGGYRSGGGVGGGVQFPVGEARGDQVEVNTLSLDLKRRSDGTLVWEGRASEEASGRAAEAEPNAAVTRLASALLSDFPGRSGQTVRVKPPR